MAGISNEALRDLQATTLKNLPNMEFEVALQHQEYNVVNNWFPKEKVQEESGTSIERNILLDNSGNARHTRLYQKSTLNVADVQHKVTAPWVQIEGHYLIERREALRNRKPAAYVKLLKSRRLDAMLAMADLLEDRAWRAPHSSTDDLNPRGLAYWFSQLIPSTGDSDYNAGIDVGGGFSGRKVTFGDGTSTVTDKGGINPTAEPKWRNWADTFSSIDDDFVKKMRKAFHAVKFKSPVLASDLKKGPLSKYKIYMGLDNLTEFEDKTTKSNDSLGNDLDKFHGMTTFRRIPVVFAPQLDDADNDPIYAVNHNKFFPIVLSGDWMRESEPMLDIEMHNVIATFVDGSYQYFCTNVREAGFVLHK
jgi:hypothetical protein